MMTVEQSSGPVAIVTGGGGGIGAATCRRLAADGWRVVVCDIDSKSAEVVAAEIQGHAIALDIADADAVKETAERIEREIGPCAALVAVAAALENPHRPEDQDMAQWRRIIDVNVTGTFNTCHAFGTRMASRRAGAIVTISSLAGLSSSPLLAYGPSKAAVVNMTQNLAASWGRSGVRVNCIAPGPVRTPVVLASQARGERDPATMIRQTLLGRFVEPEEVASVAAFLLSPASSAMTGAIVPVDAGVAAMGIWNIYGGIPEPRG